MTRRTLPLFPALLLAILPVTVLASAPDEPPAAAPATPAAPAVAESPLPGTERIPAADLRGNALAPAGAGFSIEAPGPEWVWLRPAAGAPGMPAGAPASPVYIAFHPGTRRVFLLSAMPDPNKVVPNDVFMRVVFKAGIEQTSAKSGWRIEDFAFAPATAPVPGSFRYTAKSVGPEGRVRYRFGYVGGMQVKYDLQHTAGQSVEDEEFRRFAASFRLAEPPAAPARS